MSSCSWNRKYFFANWTSRLALTECAIHKARCLCMEPNYRWVCTSVAGTISLGKWEHSTRPASLNIKVHQSTRVYNFTTSKLHHHDVTITPFFLLWRHYKVIITCAREINDEMKTYLLTLKRSFDVKITFQFRRVFPGWAGREWRGVPPGVMC